MKARWWRWWWVPALVLAAIGFARLRFDVEVLDLLPGNLPAVQGLKLYQQQFANARELLVTVTALDAATAESTAQTLAETLRRQTNLVAQVTWQPPWLEHPEQTTELIADLWLNQPPEIFAQLAQRLAETNLPAVLDATRTQLATTLSPTDIAQLSYDPYGFTRLPESVAGMAAGFGNGQQLFSSSDGKFRLIFIKSSVELQGYRECIAWLDSVKATLNAAIPPAERTAHGIAIGYTGRPVFVAEISASMQRDMTLSIGGTSVFIAILFWLAHRRWKPMLWLLVLLALILAGTLALGGLIFGTINVISMGFAGILLGLAVDYAVVHYQEALAHPDWTIPEVRGTIAPSIFWAAVTTITAFIMLNFGGLPGLAQLGSLVGIGVALSACVMIFAFLPPLFPGRRRPRAPGAERPIHSAVVPPLPPLRTGLVVAVTLALTLGCAIILMSGLPRMDATANALRPRGSQAYATLDLIQTNLNQQREPLWIVVTGRDESEIGRRLDAVEPIMQNAVSNHLLTGFTLPTMLWPRPENQAANRATAQTLVAERALFRTNALAGGFTTDALGLTENILDTWQRATATTNVFWPTNQLSQWIFEKLTARTPQGLYAAGFMFPAADGAANGRETLSGLEAQLPKDGVWLSGWELLGGDLIGVVKKNLWKLVLPMVGLVLLSLWLAFRRFTEIFFSLAILALSGLLLMVTMRGMGWSWNLLNLMALPLILGTGVDYSIFMQLALRRYHGDLLMAHRSVGRALLLCGGTAVSGFGSLALSSNAGMSSLGQVCAVGIAGNMLISVYLLPVWWRLANASATARDGKPAPSRLYGARLWSLGKAIVKTMPQGMCAVIAQALATVYQRLAPRRRKIVTDNLLPLVNGDRAAAKRATGQLFRQFAVKLADLWHFENGGSIDHWLNDWDGWEGFLAANARGKGVLLVTPHLGNWEFGGAFLAQRKIDLLVLTQAEPEASLTELRQASRAQRGIKTLVIGENPFAFVEIIKRLQGGATVALLIDRPAPSNAAVVELFGRPFHASLAAAELARAAGSAIIPGYIVRKKNSYRAEILPEIAYDRAALGNREARVRLTQEILRALEPAIRQHLTQWYHFVAIWPEEK